MGGGKEEIGRRKEGGENRLPLLIAPPYYSILELSISPNDVDGNKETRPEKI